MVYLLNFLFFYFFSADTKTKKKAKEEIIKHMKESITSNEIANEDIENSEKR